MTMNEPVDEKRRNLLRTLRDRREEFPTRPRPTTVASGAENSNLANNLASGNPAGGNLAGGGRLLELLQRRLAEGPGAGGLGGGGGGGGGGGRLLRALAQNAGGGARTAPHQRLGQGLRQHQGTVARTGGDQQRAFAAPANLREAFAPGDLRTAAREAWTFCLPLVEVARLRMLAGIRAQRAGNGINSFNHTRELVTPGMRVITTPNVDTLFSNAFIDLENGPATIVIPPTGERYFSIQLMDMYTNSFAVLGTRTVGCDGGTFTIVGPRDAAANGAVRSPTAWIWAMVRIAVNGPDDLAEIHQIQDGMVLQTGPARTPGKFAQRHAPWQEFFASASVLLNESPGLATDHAALGRIALLGLGPGRAFNPSAFDAEQAGEIEAGIADARGVIATRPREAIDGWAYSDADSGNWRQNYVHRARAAVRGLAGLPRQEAIYMHGVAPDGNFHFQEGSWQLHLAADQLPPVYAFWSLTAYEVTPQGQYFLAENPLNRYSIGDRTRGLRRNDDGSFDIWISRQDPGGDKTDNWLPVPENGPYSLGMRAYLPKQELLTGDYRLPPLIPV
jgi:hypothetical protein